MPACISRRIAAPMPSLAVTLWLLSVTAASVVGVVAGQWCPWLRWECEKSAIVCRPVRYRACCSASGSAAAAACNGSSADLKQAVYSSESLAYYPPFYCDTVYNASAIYCRSQFAQYYNSVNDSQWCAWTYWSTWAQPGNGSSDGCYPGAPASRDRQRSRQRVCDCPPPVSGNLTAACNVTTALAGVSASVGGDGQLRLNQTDLDVDASVTPTCQSTTIQTATTTWKVLLTSTVGVPVSGTSPQLWAVVAAPLILLLLIAAFTLAGVALGRRYVRQTRVANRRSSGEEGITKVTSISASASTSTSGETNGSEQRTLSTELWPDGSNAASAFSSSTFEVAEATAGASGLATPNPRSVWPAFPVSALVVRPVAPLYASSAPWRSCRPYTQLCLTPIYEYCGGNGRSSNRDKYRQPPAPEI